MPEIDETTNAPPLTPDQARGLVARILPADDDDAAGALIVLIQHLAEETDGIERDQIATAAVGEAFTKTTAFGDAVEAFTKGVRV